MVVQSETVELHKHLWKQRFEIIQLAVWVAGKDNSGDADTAYDHCCVSSDVQNQTEAADRWTGSPTAFRCAFISQHLQENLVKKLPY